MVILQFVATYRLAEQGLRKRQCTIIPQRCTFPVKSSISLLVIYLASGLRLCTCCSRGNGFLLVLVYLPTYLPTYVPTPLTDLPNYLFACCPPTQQSCLCIYLPVDLSACPGSYLAASIHPSIYIPVYLSFYLSTYLYACMYVCTYVCVYVCMYACMYACMHMCFCVEYH